MITIFSILFDSFIDWIPDAHFVSLGTTSWSMQVRND